MRTHSGHRKDSNHNDVRDALLEIGASVTETHMIGDGFPDLVVGFRGQNFLLEVKDGRKPKSDTQLTQAEQKWFESWRGAAHIVYSVEDAVTLVSTLTVVEDGIPFA